ncbi:MAG: glycosyltransferase [Candidatus Symbiothrix sp.]|jgi:glycosyltransferase involved in cell wall biosynthesis|nr:glycosyltransferase [Candidatus Symbiothrix sp.]
MKLSIITVNRNNAAGLEKTIRSVICQKFIDYEFIIIDGNSTDNSVEIIEKYAEHIAYWVSEPDKGIYNAMNKGILQAQGDYVICMNSGDCFFAPDTLSKVFATEHTADFVVGHVRMPYKGFMLDLKAPSKLSFYHFFIDTLQHQATFTKRNLFDELGWYDETLKIVSDWKFALLAIIKYNKSVEIVDEYIALMEPSGLSGSKEAGDILRKEKENTLKVCFPYLYHDYLELHKWKRLTFQRWKRSIRWIFINNKN